MGNGSSSSDSDDNAHADYRDNDIPIEIENDYVLEKDSLPILDLQGIFDHSLLRAAAAKVKDDLPENPIQQHHVHIIRWLEERLQRGEGTITLGQFCDILQSRSVSKEDSIKAFAQFDSEGDGTADVSATMDALRGSNGANLSGELTYVVRKLQACSLTPGFIDVYTEDKQVLGQHGLRLLNFILRNRAPSTSLPFPILNGFNNTMTMRLTVLNNHLARLKETANKQQEESLLNLGEELKPITKCFKTLEVSTNTADSYRLTNGDFQSYWQSDGSARSHWIRLRMRSGVVIKQLHIAVNASDQSYMPQLVSVSVGNSVHSLHEIKEVRISSHITGDVLVLENCKSYYPVIQINIKRCHSDGCDTRIHGIKTLGYRVVKEAGVSVMDASAAWYLQVLATTTTACILLAPHIRGMIRQHTRDALTHMGPLSLSPASNEKPQFMTSHVLQQMDSFLRDIAKDEENVSSDGLYLLLEFNLARGHVSGTLRAMQAIVDNPEMHLDAGSLLKKMTEVRDTFWRKQCNPLQLTLAGCDGGSKDESSGPKNVISSNWSTSTPYISAEGNTKVNMFFKSNDQIQLTKLRIKVDKGKQRPKGGMIFVYRDSKPFKLEEHVERFAGYDSWTQAEYSFCQSVQVNGYGGKPDNPVAFFSVDEDWDEVEVPLDICPIGQYVLVKFLPPSSTDIDKISIVGIKFHGFIRKAIFQAEVDDGALLSTPTSAGATESVAVDRVLYCVLDFLVSMARDQVVDKRQPAAARPQCLDMQGLNVNLIWKLYQSLTSKNCQILCLQLLHALFPFLASDKEAIKDGTEELFKHLCNLVDNNPSNTENQLNQRLVGTAKQVIIDGAAVFFSDKEARRKQLFNMMDGVNSKAENASLLLTFQSLCQFFSNVDPSGLLDLPSGKTVEDFDPDSILAVMETLISVAHKELKNVLVVGELTEQSSHLVNLLCSLQTSLLSWCQQQTVGETNELTQEAQTLMVRFVHLVASKALLALEELGAKPAGELEVAVKNVEGSFLATDVRQIVLILTAIADDVSSTNRVKLLTYLMTVAQELRKLAGRLPNIFYSISSEHWKALESGEETLRTWDVESPHNYENNQHVTQVFNCPGASYFIVEFDPRCETEKRYDYLEFTDSNGMKMKFEQKVGTEKWPNLITFRGGHRLHFLFHSDSSNNEWGYKFKVTAKGCPDEPLSWMFDLQLCLAKLFGRLCGATMDSSILLPNTNDQSDTENELLKSDLWTTLFRGGYRVGKLQRSLSGKHVATEDSEVSGFLLSLLEDEGKPDIVVKFLQRCKEQFSGTVLGDEEVAEAANALFAALIWHSQSLREELERYVKNEGECKLYEGLAQAYNTAQAQRMHLVDLRQKYKLAQEKENSSKKKTVDPVRSCTMKAEFLLKFSGLTKVDLRRESRGKLSKQTSRHNRLSSYSLDRNHKLDGILEKYPAFRLVMEFVKDPAWSLGKVEELLKTRSLQAQAVSEVYMFVAEYLRIMGEDHLFQVNNVLLIQDLLSYQTKFAKHYADGLDGCGLELESKVRRSYYTLIRRLIDALRATNRSKVDKTIMAAYDYIQACTLHFLDINWQQYDLEFLVDIKLPEFYLHLAKNSVAVRQQLICAVDEESEMKIYSKDMEMLKECRENFMDWYNRAVDKLSPEEKMIKQMFVAKFCDLLDVEISCDGCSVTLPGRRYRCLQCEDMDLCATCYAGGVKPRVGNHTDNHEIIHMMYKCDQCKAFITGTRIHCNQCEDFDLCLGCHKTGTFPAGHEKQHEVTQYPVVKLKMNKDWDTSLQAYIHQHVWLSFSTVALSMAHLIYNSSVPTKASTVDTDYTKASTQLHNHCIQLAIDCLMKVNVNDDPLADVESEEYKQERREEAFAVHSQERIMGLLAAMIPPIDKAANEEISFTFNSKKFIHLLLNIAKGEGGHETNTQHLAMGLLGQLLQGSTMTCAVADAAIRMCEAKGLVRKKSEKSDTEGEVSTEEFPEYGADENEGETTARYLFTFGATCMERSGLEWANSLVGILQRLFNCEAWRDVLLRYMAKTIRGLKDICSDCDTAVQSSLASDINRVFDELSCEASTYIIKDVALSYAKELKKKNASSGIDHTDNEKKVNELYEKYDKENKGKITRENFLSFAKEVRGPVVEPPLSSIFALFVLAGFPEVLSIGCRVKFTDVGTDRKDGVVLKHFPEKDQTLIVDAKNRKRRTVKDEYVECESLEVPVLEGEHVDVFIEVISDITEKLKKGSKMSVESVWVLALSLKALLRTLQAGRIMPGVFRTTFVQCVVHLASQSTGFSKQWLLKDLEILSLMLYTREREEDASQEQSKESGKEDTQADAANAGNPWHGLDDTTKICFQTLQDHLNIPASVLRAIYDMNGRSTNALLVAVHENIEGENFIANDDVKKMAKKWEQSAQRTAAEVLSERAMDTGMQVVFLPKQGKRSYETATEEPSEVTQKLIDTAEDDLYGDAQKQRKTRSSALLKKELETQGKTGSREYLVKVNTALAILYGRQMLLTLLGDWPSDGPRITTDLLGCSESVHLPFVLDLLNKNESKEVFQKVVDNVIRHCDSSCLGPLSQMASQFMEEVNLSTIVKESEHNYKNNTNHEEKIHIPGANFLSIKFDSRCCTEEECDELVLSSSSDYHQDKKVFSGPRARWVDFEMPGDTIYLKFTSDCSSNDWGYKFTVTGGRLGRFDTGYLILNSVFSLQDVILLLPIKDLWAGLVYVACKQTGQQRLKTIQLLLKILRSQFKKEGCKELSTDLSLLLPLWKLYNAMADVTEKDNTTIVGPLCRALTELFLVAENLAMNWNKSRQYLACLILKEEAEALVKLGLQNIAAVSLMINYENKVTAGLQLKPKEDVGVKL